MQQATSSGRGRRRWIERQAVDDLADQVKAKAGKAYISDPSKLKEILEALYCAIDELDKIQSAITTMYAEGRADCPYPYCDDGAGGCDVCRSEGLEGREDGGND